MAEELLTKLMAGFLATVFIVGIFIGVRILWDGWKAIRRGDYD